MSEQTKPLVGSLDWHIQNIQTIATGSQLPDGSLDPEKTQSEINNKLGVIVNIEKKLLAAGRLDEAMQILVSRFPGQLGFIIKGAENFPTLAASLERIIPKT